MPFPAITHLHPVFTVEGLNNGRLTAKDAMPQKDATSTGDSNFSADRQTYMRTNEIVPGANNPQTHYMTGTGGSRNISGSRNIPIVNSALPPPSGNKKWFGNRDASDVIRSRRVQTVGGGSLNPAKTPISFTTNTDINTTRDALKRVRSGGASVPAKVIHKYKNAPIFY
jgi:hypothetical protein